MPESSPPPGPLDGLLERAEGDGIGGWARDPAAPDVPLELDILLDGAHAARITACLHRPDLDESGIGPHAFVLRFPRGLRAREVAVLRAGTSQHLPGSPKPLPSTDAARDPAEALEAAALAAAENPAEAATLAADLADRLAASLARPDPRQAHLLARWGHGIATGTRRPRAIALDQGVPDPGRDAGSNAILSHLESLRRLGYSVELAAAHSLARMPAHDAIEARGITPWHAPWIASVEELLAAAGETVDLVYIHRLPVMRRYAALVRDWCPNARLVFCIADLHHLRAARQAALEASVPLAQALAVPRIAALRAQERAACAAADAVIAHSDTEAAIIRAEAPDAVVHVLPWHVPATPATVPWAERRGVAFIGSYGHPPNLDAAFMLLDAVMPRVWAAAPDIPLILAGSDLPASLAARGGPRVEILGQVPELASLWNRVRLTCAPLRFGAGLKGKILSSLAAGLPCVTTPMGAEGIPSSALLDSVAADAEGLAAAILRVHGDAQAHRAAAEAGLAFARADLSEDAIDAAMRGVCNLG
jgi:glycosyltransferase involved in cell wall biosynthesis